MAITIADKLEREIVVTKAAVDSLQKVHKNSPRLYTKTADRAKHASFDVRRGVSNPVCVLVYLCPNQ